MTFCTADCISFFYFFAPCIIFLVSSSTLFQIQRITLPIIRYFLSQRALAPQKFFLPLEIVVLGLKLHVWTQMYCRQHRFFFFFFILISKLKAPRMSLHSSEKCARNCLSCFLEFLGVRTASNLTPTSRMSGLILVLKWGQKRWDCVRFELKDWFTFNRYIQYAVLVES